MRNAVLWATLAASMLCLAPAFGATYATDTSFRFAGQTDATSGAGLAVNSAGTRLYVVKRSASTGAVYILDTATGNQVGSITPPTPTTIHDVALSPDNATVFLARPAADGDTYEIAAAPASDGDHGAAQVTAVVTGLDSRPTSIAIAHSGSEDYLGVVTSPDFYIYKRSSGGAWTLDSTVDIGFSSAIRDVTALDTGAGTAFYILRPGTSPNVQAYNLDGSPRSVSFASLPSGFQGYFFDSILGAPNVDGVPSLYLAADAWDDAFEGHLSVFRYTPTGAYTGEGFGYQFGGPPLSDLAPWDTDPILAPMALANNHLYIGGVLPDRLDGGAQTVRVVIGTDSSDPARIEGTVLQPSESGAVASVGATVAVAGRTAPVATTGAGGAYTLSPFNAGTYTVGAWKYGFAAVTEAVTLTSSEVKTGVDLILPDTVPTFSVAPAFQPPILDGWTFPGEYPTPPMPFTLPTGAAPEAVLETTAYVTHDAENLYVAVFGGEPNLVGNTASSTNFSMLTEDDTVQIYVDPPHRHAAQAEASRLYQFAVNVPPAIDGEPLGFSYRVQRRINANGTQAGALNGSLWTSSVGYTPTGWVVEARISLTAFSLPEPPGPDAEWGLLVARYRPTKHNDNRPTQFSTSPRQSGAFTAPNTWTDIRFGPATTTVPGDVNQNGVLDVTDAIYVLRMAGGLTFGLNSAAGNTAYQQAILQVADVAPAGAPDGAITIADAVRLIRAAAGNDTLP